MTAAAKRPFVCPRCRGANLRPSDTLAMLCDYCAAFVSTTAAQLPALGERWPAGSPERQRAEARLVALASAYSVDAGSAAPEARRRRHEHMGLFAVLYPDHVPRSYLALPMSRWIEAAERTADAHARDPSLGEAQSAITATFTAMGQPAATRRGDRDLVAMARALAEASERYYVALLASPVFASVRRHHPAPDALARDRVRVAVFQHIFSLDKATTQRIAVEILGDPAAPSAGEAVDASNCPRCGARLRERERAIEQCGRCGRRLLARVVDPWLAAHLAWWPTLMANTHNDRDRAIHAVCRLLELAFQRGAAATDDDYPEVTDVLAFVAGSVPEAALDDLLAGVNIARHRSPGDERMRALLDAVEAAFLPAARAPSRRGRPPSRRS